MELQTRFVDDSARLHAFSPGPVTEPMTTAMPSKPMELSGALSHFLYEDTTPVIGREFTNVNIVEDLLNADNSDELLRDLAITS